MVSEARRLEELRLVAIEEGARTDLALGRHAELCGKLERRVGEHPYRESLWGLWMLALYRAGRQADALRAFERVRRLLGDELGLEPSVALRELEQAILLHRPELDWGPADEPASSSSTVAATSAVPLSARLNEAGSAPFVGRRAELVLLLDALQAAREERRRRVVLVSGEPGIGKTALAGVFARAAAGQGTRCCTDAATRTWVCRTSRGPRP